MIRLRHTALVATLLALSATGKAQTDQSFVGEDNLNYTIVDSENYYVSVSKSDTELAGELTIPATVIHNDVTYTVTAIADNGFESCSQITSVTITGDGADGNGIEVGGYAFSSCDMLEKVTWGKVKSIGNNAFIWDSKLSDIDLRNVTESIGLGAFYDCASLKTVETSSTLKSIGATAFYGCGSLEKAIINSDDATIGYRTFTEDTSLVEIRLPENLVTIEESTFENCTKLTSFTAPSALTGICANAFNRCSALTTIKLNNGLDSIASGAFSYCTTLGNFDFPTTLTQICWSAFGDNKSITEFNIPRSVRLIKSGAFSGCSALKRVVFEGGEELEIPSGAFSGNTSLEEVIIGEGVVNIDQYAFAGCSGLKTVSLPSSLKSIGDYAMAYTDGLEKIKIYATTPPELGGDSVFHEAPASALLLIPDAEAYSIYSNIFPGDMGMLYAFDDVATDIPTISVGGGESFFDAFHALADEDEANKFKNANLSFDGDIEMDKADLDYGLLSASNVFAKIGLLPTVGSYNGHLDGAEVNNIAMRSCGMFGTLDESAVIENLTLTDATIYVDPTDARFSSDGNNVIIPLLAHENKGKVLSFGISGDIIVDSELAKDKDISVCLVSEDTEEAELNGYLHIGDLHGTGDNKRCITIKQNLGVNRPTSKKVKVATSRSASSKSLPTDFEYSEEELIKPIRQFSDEEFANGAVAYWLNFSGAGYTGEYTAKWSQGKKVPVAAKVTDGVSNALYKVEYGKTNLKHITSAPQFANNGSEITIKYDEKPTQITIGGTAISNFGENDVSLTFDGSKVIELTFSDEESAIRQTQATPNITINGLNITIANTSSKELKQIFSITGECVGSTSGNTLTAPSQGIYILKVDNYVMKLSLR